MSDKVQTITILGSTGSIGVNTLDVIAQHPECFEIFALTAHRNIKLLAQQCRQFKPRYIVLSDESLLSQLQLFLQQESQQEQQQNHSLRQEPLKTEILFGVSALKQVVEASEVTTVMAAIVGAAGLLPTLAAVNKGKTVLLANKESLVMAGHLFMQSVKRSGANLLPIDSEHNAMFQCLPACYRVGNVSPMIRKLLLTGSGGPFRKWDEKAIAEATPEQACHHPNWSMGKKISVDSATLMNKGLELIEACWLFSIPPKQVEVIIHPQSVVHSMVEYVDGSVLAQLGYPDMRTPIAHALAWPKRFMTNTKSLDIIQLSRLDFEEPDHQRFPALALAMAAAETGSGAATVLNAVNEFAVEQFLKGILSFGHIPMLLDTVMHKANFNEPTSIDAVLDLDAYARDLAKASCKALR